VFYPVRLESWQARLSPPAKALEQVAYQSRQDMKTKGLYFICATNDVISTARTGKNRSDEHAACQRSSYIVMAQSDQGVRQTAIPNATDYGDTGLANRS
jgi:hypothetical protein